MAERVTLGESFMQLNLDKSVRIIDIACGTGAVALDLQAKGYTNIDGLDPMKGYIGETKIYFKTSPNCGNQMKSHLSVCGGCPIIIQTDILHHT